MLRNLLFGALGLLSVATATAATEAGPVAPPVPAVKKTQVVVIPVRDEIASPVLYILRRGLKEAIEQKADVVVLDMKTPGGALGVTFEIMEVLAKFPGRTITYVNSEAISAGAFIAATTEEIWFAPAGVIGAAAPVSATGQDVETTMRQKIVSYLKARVRATSEGKGYRGEVISAMIDADYELKIGDKILKGKGELLSLTASEASKTYGDPPQPLLAAGIAKNLEELLTLKFGAEGYATRTLEITWSERLSVFLHKISPLLLGLGLLAIYIEFKTPGFGVFGVTGISLLALVFLGNYVAGLSGHEPILVFGAGLLLIVIEVFFFPGIAVMALTGLVLIITSLIWSMADIWPNEPLDFRGEMFVGPIQNLGLGIMLAAVFALLLARFIPQGWFFSRLAVAGAVDGSAQVGGGDPAVGAELASLVGRMGVAATGLFPSGQVEIDGRRYEARLEVGHAPTGTRIVVRGKTDFSLIVDRAPPLS